MKKVLQFTPGTSSPARPAERGHHCIISPFPRQKATGPEKPLKKERQIKAGKPEAKHKRLKAKVKIAQKQLGICDADYRALLQVNFGVSSSTELDKIGLLRLISYFRSKGWQDKPATKKPRDSHGKPKSMKDASSPITPALQRIEAILSEIGKARGKYMPWSYAAGILKKHTGLDNLDTASVRELQKVMVALQRTLTTEQRKRACAGI